MADITHTLGIDESEFVRGLKRAETQVATMSRRVEAQTPTLRGLQQSAQRIQSLMMGVVGPASAAAAGVARLVQGIQQFRDGGGALDRELDKYKQIEISLNAQLSAHQQISRAIEDRYQQSLRQLDAGRGDEGPMGFWMDVGQRAANFVTGGDTDRVARQRIETNRADAERAAVAAEKNRQDLDAKNLRRGLRRDVAGSAATIGEDRESARFRVEAIEHEERLARIRELTTLDKARIDELTKLENERHWRVVQSVSAETAERITKAATERAEQNRLAEERRAADEEAIARSLEDTRISNLRAAGKESEARQAEIIARFEQQRLAIERSTASEGFKRASLDKLTEERMSALALAGRPEDARLGTRGVGTGLGAQATRQALGVGPGRSIERTTTNIALDLKKAVEILNKMAAATPLPVLG